MHLSRDCTHPPIARCLRLTLLSASLLTIPATGSPVEPTAAASHAERFLDLSGPVRITAPAPDGGVEWLYGSSLAVSAEHVVVGARWADGVVSTSGAAYVYDRQPGLNGEPPRLRLVAKLSGDGETRGFGWTAAISGAAVAVGGPSHISHRSGRGSVYLFDVSQGASSLDVRIPAPPFASSFGQDVALSDTLLAVADRGADIGRGAVYLYRRPSAGWSALDPTRYTKLEAPAEPQSGRRFAYSVVLDGDTVFVGSPFFDTGDNGLGAVFVFEPPPGGWEPGTVTNSSILTWLPNSRLGGRLAVFGRQLLVTAADQREGNTPFRGAVLLFERPGADWSHLPALPSAVLTPSDPNRRASFGSSLATIGAAIVVGAPGDPVGGFEPPGAVYLFLEPDSGWADHVGHEELKVTPAAGLTGDRFGSSVALDDGALFVGAITDSGDGVLAQGAAYLYGIRLSSVLEIPAMTPWGATALAALVVLVGLRYLRGR